jgi:hypothetical protein
VDRRSFLGLLGAAEVSVALPEIWTPPTGLLPSADSFMQVTRVSPPADHIIEILLCGKNDRSEVATFDVIRPDGQKLLALAMNTFGGILRWVAEPGEELPVPLQFVYRGNMTVNIVGRRGDEISWSVAEPSWQPGYDSPLLIPVSPGWEPRLALAAKPSIPDIFRNAFRA